MKDEKGENWARQREKRGKAKRSRGAASCVQGTPESSIFLKGDGKARWCRPWGSHCGVGTQSSV